MKNNNYVLKVLLLAGLLVASNAVRATEATEANPLNLNADKPTLTFEVFQPTETQIEQLPLFIAGATEKDAIVVFHNNEYSVIQNGILHKVQADCVAPELRDVAHAQLLNFMENGLINVSQKEDGQFTLNPQIREFGGVLLGQCLYWGVRACGYGAVLVLAYAVAPVIVPGTGLVGCLGAAVESAELCKSLVVINSGIESLATIAMMLGTATPTV